MIPDIIKAVSPLENVLVKTMRDIGLLEKEETNNSDQQIRAMVEYILANLKTMEERQKFLDEISSTLNTYNTLATHQSDLHSHPDERN